MAANDPKMLRILDAVQWQAEHFGEIPVIVVACLRGMRGVWPAILATSYYGSIYPSVQNLLLAARAAGLGAALLTMPLWSTFLARRASAPWRHAGAVVPLRGRSGSTARRRAGRSARWCT
jgi:hypothetical protein